MKNNRIFILIRVRLCLTLIFMLLSIVSFSQEKLLSKKIVYQVEIMKPRIVQTEKLDSIVYDYVVDKRFWWQSIDAIMQQITNRKMHFMSFNKDTISYEAVLKGLRVEYLKEFKDTLSEKGLKKLMEEEIRAIKFEEEWTYSPITMMINKKVIGYNPIIARDSIILQDIDKANTELTTKQFFRYELGWIYPKGEATLKDTLCVVRNIHFTIPIYNKRPYHWWDSHLEPEYSVPYFESLISKAEEGIIKVYSEPIATESYTKAEVLKRKQYEMMVIVDSVCANGAIIEKSNIIKANYTSDDIDHLRFGDEWFFDKKTYQFIKLPNYIAPMIQIKGMDGTLRDFMPLYYLRRR